MLTKKDCTLPLTAEQRDFLIEELADEKVNTLADCDGIRDVILNGRKGLFEYSDEELVQEAEDAYGDHPDWEV